MSTKDYGVANGDSLGGEPESLFERCSWFYALCREYLFRDHSQRIARSLWSADEPPAGTHLLELGCGPGFYACRFAKKFPQIQATGIDLSQNLITRAKSRAANLRLANCKFLKGNAYSLPDLLEPVDAIVVSRLFLVLEEREQVLREIFRILRPGGRCFIAEPISGFRTRFPLNCMWLLNSLSGNSAAQFREPRQAESMSPPRFTQLVLSQPWRSSGIEHDRRYQYAVCEKGFNSGNE